MSEVASEIEDARTARIAPLDVFPGESALWTEAAQVRWIWAFLIVGLILRVTRYVLRFPLWEDEAMLSANLLDRGYRELLLPLHYCQVAPTLFLWTQLTVTRLFGFTEYTLRLVPFLCGVGSLFLFRHVAERLLRGTALVLAVGLFAVAYPMSRYSAEAKPYGCDLFIALAMLALAIEWLRRPDEKRWLWFLAAIVGPAVGFSFPAVFMAGGLSLVIGYAITWGRLPTCRTNGMAGRLTLIFPWVMFNLLLMASFLAVVIASRNSVGDTNQKQMTEVIWTGTFPPLTNPLKLIVWLVETHTGGMLGYPIGGPNWGSTASFLCFAAGVIVLLRRRKRLLLGLLLAPLGLNFVAAAMHRFPYGGHARMTLFLAPAFCILIGLGATSLLSWHIERRRTTSPRPRPMYPWATGEGPGVRGSGRSFPWPLGIVLGMLLLVAAVSLSLDLAQPYKSGTTLRAREFARWFWFDMAHDSELVCFETDLKQSLSPGKLDCGWSCLYFCNQRIYSPRLARGEKPSWDRVSTDWPLRCVLYRSPKEETVSPAPDPHALEHWLADMQTRYRLTAHDTYPIPAYDKSDRKVMGEDYIEVYKFVPKDGEQVARRPGVTGG